MPTPNPGVWGIDIGQCALKAIRLETRDDAVHCTAFDYVEHPKILSQPDADPDQLTRQALDTFLSRNSIKGDTVAISVPGQSGLARFVKLPPVEEKKIVDIVRFEAKQQIPFNLDEVVWDYQKIGQGSVTDGFALDTEIGLFAIKRDMVLRALGHFTDVKIDCHLVQMAPLALTNYVAWDLLGKGTQKAGEGDGAGEAETGKKSCVVALDIGTDSSNLVITDGERIIWQRPIPLGGNHFTRALTKDLKLTFAKAEHLKRNATKSGPDLKKILASLKPVLNDFVAEVQRSLGYFTNTHRDATVEYMVGLGNAFRLPGLQKYMGEKLGLEVKKLTKLNHCEGEGVLTQPLFAENILSFAVAYGLAVQGLGKGRIQTNLLPQEIRMDRIIKAKKPWAVTAAAALLLGSAWWAMGYAMEYRGVSQAPDSVVKKAMDDVEAVLKEKARWQGEFDAQQKKVDEEEKGVKSVIAGQDERFNWVAFHKFLNDAMPRPDPDRANLWGDRRNLYLTPASRDAYKKFLDRQAGVRAKPGEDPDEGVDDLIQFNIEAVDARFTEDLASYWNNVKNLKDWKEGISQTVRPVAQRDQGPGEKERGWVVELRGYTYHRGKAGFVLDGLVDNIAKYGIREEPKKKEGEGTAAPVAEEKEKPKKDEGPIINKISHVLIYRADPSQQFLQSGGVLSGLVPSAAAAPSEGGGGGGPPTPGGLGGVGSGGGPPPGVGSGGGPPPGMGMGGGSAGGFGGGGGGWSSLLSGSSGGGNGFGEGGGPGKPAGFGPPPVGSGSGRPMFPMGSGGGTGQGDSATTKFKHTRTEFIVLFIWKELAPSEGLLKKTEITSPAPAGGGGGGGPVGGPVGGPMGGGAPPPKAGGGGGSPLGDL